MRPPASLLLPLLVPCLLSGACAAGPGPEQRRATLGSLERAERAPSASRVDHGACAAHGLDAHARLLRQAHQVHEEGDWRRAAELADLATDKAVRTLERCDVERESARSAFDDIRGQVERLHEDPDWRIDLDALLADVGEHATAAADAYDLGSYDRAEQAANHARALLERREDLYALSPGSAGNGHVRTPTTTFSQRAAAFRARGGSTRGKKRCKCPCSGGGDGYYWECRVLK